MNAEKETTHELVMMMLVCGVLVIFGALCYQLLEMDISIAFPYTPF